MSYELWSIYETFKFNRIYNDLFGATGDVVSYFSDDERYYWAIQNGSVMIQELEGGLQNWKSRNEQGAYELIADLYTINQKPIMVALYRRYSDYKYFFVIIDIETGQHISESPPITEMFQGSTIQSWMLHE